MARELASQGVQRQLSLFAKYGHYLLTYQRYGRYFDLRAQRDRRRISAARRNARQGRRCHAEGGGQPDPRSQYPEGQHLLGGHDRLGLLGYAAAAVRCSSSRGGRGALGPCCGACALSRGAFIHELTHIKKGAVKGFRLHLECARRRAAPGPSFMYEGVHNQHHAKRYHGTVDDPEYLPLALMKPWTLPVFLIAAALAPVGMLIRFGILAPLSLFSSICGRGRWPLFGASNQSEIRSARARRRVPPRLAPAGSRVQRLGDRAVGDGRDRPYSSTRFAIGMGIASGVMSSIRSGPSLRTCGKMTASR